MGARRWKTAKSAAGMGVGGGVMSRMFGHKGVGVSAASPRALYELVPNETGRGATAAAAFL